MPPLMATIVSSKHATLKELCTFYTLDDAYMLLDVIRIDNYNSQIIQDNAKRIAERKRK